MPGTLPSREGRRSVYAPFPHVEPPPLHELLMFAERYLPVLNPPARRIRERFHITETAYHLFLSRAVDDPAAHAMAPDLMRRLEERRTKNQARRRWRTPVTAEGRRS